jgi:hypothetical protein
MNRPSAVSRQFAGGDNKQRLNFPLGRVPDIGAFILEDENPRNTSFRR